MSETLPIIEQCNFPYYGIPPVPLKGELLEYYTVEIH